MIGIDANGGPFDVTPEYIGSFASRIKEAKRNWTEDGDFVLVNVTLDSQGWITLWFEGYDTCQSLTFGEGKFRLPFEVGEKIIKEVLEG